MLDLYNCDLQGLGEQLQMIENQTNFLTFLERRIDNFEFTNEIYKIWFKLLISVLNTNGLDDKQLLVTTLKFIRKMTLVEALDYLREKNWTLNEFFSKLFEIFIRLVDNNNTYQDLTDVSILLSVIVDMYFIYLQE